VAIADEPVGGDEANALFDGLAGVTGLVLAVSGGADSTALMLLAASWAKARRRSRRRAPKLLAVTVDHGLRKEAAREALAVKRLARRLGVPHRTLRWRGAKPASGLQEAARNARYALIARAARRAGFAHILTAHTIDDQAETVLFRLARGSGLTGLGGMAEVLPLPADPALFLVRPLLAIAKSRLIATLAAAAIPHSEDPSNADPRFTRVRLRALLPDLAREGLDAAAFARLAARLRRADATVAFAVDAARRALAPGPWQRGGPIAVRSGLFAQLPAEVGLRLLGQAVAVAGDEGPVELGKLEALYDACRRAAPPLRRTLAGALITVTAETVRIERAPPRKNPRNGPAKATKTRRSGSTPFTKSPDNK
jgi:tRNA(Ile)-lysidine synthase